MFEYNDVEYLKDKLKTDTKNGLSSKEVLRRQKNNGYNVLEEKKKVSGFKIFFSQLKDPMIYILLCAIAISFFLKEYNDAVVVLIVVMLNALIGALQEIKTERALEALKKLSQHKCNVIRDGEKKQIDSRELVKGDVVILESGGSVPADIRLIECNNLSVDESSITGESKPVNKNEGILNGNVKNLGDKENIAYMSTLIISGRGKGVVVATGMKTEIGKIAALLKEDEADNTPLQKRLFDLGKLLGVITIGICLLMFILAMIENRNPLDMLISSISLAVAAIPEGLPAVVTIVLAIGVQRMVKSNAIIKRLPSVETLGSVSVVCSDKTGTLTENKLQAVGIYQNGKFSKDLIIEEEEIKRNILLCNNSYKENNIYIGNPMEIALYKLAEQQNIIVENFKRIEEKEFDSTRKMMSTLNYVGNNKKQYSKGAYDVVIKKCKYIKINGNVISLTKEIIEKINNEIDYHASQAKRILAFAYKENVNEIREDELIFLGFITFMDPPRKGVKEAVKTFKKAGVKTVMITGDYIKTAYAIGKEIGIADSENECMSGEEMETLTDHQLADIVEKKSIFARVTPVHKAKIVDAFKVRGHIVAMTGDGVNDAPSLKKADVGISMGITGSDVSKEASDMILLDDNFTTIESAIEEGRTVYSNIRKSVLFLLSSNFSEVIVMLIAIILGLPLPLLAIHILIVNLLTDSFPALALGADLKDDVVMNAKPRNPNESLFANGGMFNTIVYGILIALLTFASFLIPSIELINELGVELKLHNIKNVLTDVNVLSKSQTYAFIALSLSELFYSMSLRNINKTFFRKDIFRNMYLNISILGGLLLVYVITSRTMAPVFKLYPVRTLDFIALVSVSVTIILFHELIYRFVSHET